MPLIIRLLQKVPPTTVAPTYKLTLPSEFVLTHMPDMMNGDFIMVSADGTQNFHVSIVPRYANKCCYSATEHNSINRLCCIQAKQRQVRVHCASKSLETGGCGHPPALHAHKQLRHQSSVTTTACAAHQALSNSSCVMVQHMPACAVPYGKNICVACNCFILTKEHLHACHPLLQVVEGLSIKEGDLLEFELTVERNLRVTVMKSSTVTRKPKKLAVPELQAGLAKKKQYRGIPDLGRSMMLTGQEGVAMSDLLLPAAAAAAAQGLPIRLPDVNATQVPA